jgi:hypothetical protein
MRDETPSDPLFELLSQLPPVCPAARRDARVMARCHEALERRAAAAKRPPEMPLDARAVNAALKLAACGYGIAAAREAFRLAGVF